MKQKTRKIIAVMGLVCILVTSSGIRPLEAKAESGDREHEYTYDGYSVSYSVINEWNDGMQAEVSDEKI